jgi:hypothetical protein
MASMFGATTTFRNTVGRDVMLPKPMLARSSAAPTSQDRQPYMIDSDLNLLDLLDFTSLLQVIDLRAFRSRIQPE